MGGGEGVGLAYGFWGLGSGARGSGVARGGKWQNPFPTN